MKIRKIIERVWWYFVPWVEVKVKWPVGEIVIGHDDPRWYDCGATKVAIESADPWDHYGPWLLQNVGRYKWNWEWEVKDHDISENRLTIRIRKKHEQQATAIAMMWS